MNRKNSRISCKILLGVVLILAMILPLAVSSAALDMPTGDQYVNNFENLDGTEIVRHDTADKQYVEFVTGSGVRLFRASGTGHDVFLFDNNAPQVADGSISVQFDGKAYEAGVFFRYVDGNNFMRANVNWNNFYLYITQWVDSNAAHLAAVSISEKIGAELRVVFSGSSVEAYWGGEKVAETDSAGITSAGSCGIANTGNTSMSDGSFIVKSLTITKPAAAPAGELVEVDGELYYQENGVGVMAGLVKIGDDYYFAAYNGKIVKNKLQNIWANATGEDAFTGKNRMFGADGKMANGLVTVGDDVYYCVDGKPTMAGLVKDGDDVYFIGGEGKAIKNKIQNIWKNDSGDETFTGKNRAFGADGKLLTGILNDVYYKDGVATMAGLVEVDGDLYFASGAGRIVKDKVQYIWANSTDNADLTETNQTFGVDGKMIVE